MRFRFIDQAKKEFPASRLCHVMGVSQNGYFSLKDRAASRRQRDGLVMLAHMRAAWSLSNERTKEGWLYLAVVIDLFARRFRIWCISL